MTDQDVADYVENEGLGYAIQYGTSGDDFQNEELKKLWKEAAVLLNKIDDILRPYAP